MTTSLFHERAQHRVFLGFYIHLAAFILVTGGLAGMNFARNPDRPWLLWVVAGWGIGLIVHGLLTYLPEPRERAVHRIATRMERREERRHIRGH
ncbi:hypothetical protein Pan44_16760 [Caulifigura coniformis]|uniref:2TM domain-containing protein n=1 Tax=Caulifigura coniformis TaxID=2527983 RepID=A0A517SC17_9PLAN|nr:2TM domain-containing protein [Caulifigura coniformis]QDT53653.1 hypothetical protein Pan44_16760 [Caulifigura coniformis]